jgi:hypothetical protein
LYDDKSLLSVLCLVRVPLIGQHCHAVTKNKGCFDRLQVKQENELSDFATVRHSEPRQGCRLDSQGNRASIPSSVKGVFCSRLTLGPGDLFSGVKRLEREANRSPSSSAGVNNKWRQTSTPTYAFMAYIRTNCSLSLFYWRHKSFCCKKKSRKIIQLNKINNFLFEPSEIFNKSKTEMVVFWVLTPRSIIGRGPLFPGFIGFKELCHGNPQNSAPDAKYPRFLKLMKTLPF